MGRDSSERFPIREAALGRTCESQSGPKGHLLFQSPSAGTFFLIFFSTLLRVSDLSPDQGSHPFPLLWKHCLNYRTAREVPKDILSYVSSAPVQAAHCCRICLPVREMKETRVQFLGRADLLE